MGFNRFDSDAKAVPCVRGKIASLSCPDRYLTWRELLSALNIYYSNAMNYVGCVIVIT